MGKRQISLKKEVLLFVFALFLLMAFVLFFIGRSAFNSTLKASKLQELKRLTNVIKNYMDFNNFDISGLDGYDTLHAIRITIFDENADVLYESDKAIKTSENHKDRTEIKEALQNGSGTDTRKSQSTLDNFLYYAERYEMKSKLEGFDNNNNIIIIRIACPLSEIKLWTHEFLKVYIPSLLIFLLLVLAVTLLILKMLSSPLEKIEKGANEYKNGNFNTKIDISTPEELKNLASTLNDMALSIQTKTERAEKLERIRKDFVANVSHELKTPITSIKGFSELLESSDLDKNDIQKFSHIIHRNAGEMEDTISDLLLLASLENDEFALETAPTDVKEFLNECLSKVEYKRAEKGDAIILDIDRNVNTAIDVNKSLLTIAITNLLMNAMNYSPNNSEIKLSMLSHKGTLIFRVKDNGCGIPKEEQEKIFERFYRIDKSHSKKEGGTGLGLSIVKHISLVHAGSITVESGGKDKGSTFTLTVKEKSEGKQ